LFRAGSMVFCRWGCLSFGRQKTSEVKVADGGHGVGVESRNRPKIILAISYFPKRPARLHNEELCLLSPLLSSL
jgi:hypothetical protein